MIDDESQVDPRSVADTDHFDEALLYDFAKFLTTLALLALGGVLTLTQTAEAQLLKKPVVGFVLGAIALAGVTAVGAAATIAQGEGVKRKPRFTPLTQVRIATAFLGLGAGGFLMLWWKTL
jgi:hypothetical protein